MFLGFFCARDTPPACLGLETLGPEVARALGAVSVNTSVPTKRNERAQDSLVYGRSGTFAAGETRFGSRSEHGSGNRTQRKRGGARPPLCCFGRSGTFAAGETRFGSRSEHGSGNRTQRERGGSCPLFLFGRSDKIRTCDLLVPNQALYQAEPHPVLSRGKRENRERFPQMLIDYSTAVSVCQVFAQSLFDNRLTERRCVTPRRRTSR